MSIIEEEIERLRCNNSQLTKCQYCKYNNDCDRQERLETKGTRGTNKC